MTGPDHGELTRAGQDRARARGVHIGRPFALDPHLVGALRTMRRLGMSNYKIAARLNRDGIPGAGGGRWYESTVRRVLKTYPDPKVER